MNVVECKYFFGIREYYMRLQCGIAYVAYLIAMLYYSDPMSSGKTESREALCVVYVYLCVVYVYLVWLL
jgi:hypothetical protein